MRDNSHDTKTLLQSRDNIYRLVFENANDGIIIHDTTGKIHDVNATLYRRLGYSKQEMLDMNLNDLVAPGFEEKIRERTADLEKTGVAIFESADRRKDGTILPVEVSARYFNHNGTKMIQSIVRDIHERKTAEALIQTSLIERTILGDEAKHSVRFNQTICDQMLERIPFSSDPDVHSPAMEHQIHRIKAVTYMQDRAYANNSITRIDLQKTATSLIRYLFTLYQIDPQQIILNNQIQTMFLHLHQTTLCSYILIELLSNAIRHAFPDGRSGEICLISTLTKAGKRKICVTDNGVGLPEGLDIRSAKSFGLSLINAQVKELKGRLTHNRTSETEFCVLF